MKPTSPKPIQTDTPLYRKGMEFANALARSCSGWEAGRVNTGGYAFAYGGLSGRVLLSKGNTIVWIREFQRQKPREGFHRRQWETVYSLEVKTTPSGTIYGKVEATADPVLVKAYETAAQTADIQAAARLKAEQQRAEASLAGPG